MTAQPTRDADDTSRPTDRRRAALKTGLRIVFLILGIVGVVMLVRRAGAAELRTVLLDGAVWLPLLVLIEAGRLAADAVALRVGHHEHGKRVPVTALIRGHLIGTALGAVLPAGRVANEAAKAAAIAPHVGGRTATAMAASNQAWILFANGSWSGVCAVAALLATGMGPLTIALSIHFVGVSLVGVGMRAALRARRLGGWLGKRFGRIAGATREVQGVARGAPILAPKPILALLAGRVLQAIEYGVLLVAVGVHHVTVGSALVAQGITFVGTAVGMVVPGQIGALEGAFSLFAETLGATPAQALAIPLLARVVQLFWVAVGSVVGVVWPFEKRAKREGDGLEPERAPASAR